MLCLVAAEVFRKAQRFPSRVAMANDPFSDDLVFFLVVRNPYDLRSQICFRMLQKKSACLSLETQPNAMLKEFFSDNER